MKLQDIISAFSHKEIVGEVEKEISSIQFDSRKVTENALFVALNGTQIDGHLFISDAIKNGATAVICNKIPENFDKNVTFITCDDTAFALGLAADAFFDSPSKSLKVIGVTGTNGKTTTATLLYQLFQLLGYKTGLLSTVVNYIDKTSVAATHTTPDAVQLQSLLAQMRDCGCEYCFMEISSHSVVQQRIAGLNLAGCIFTNLTHDHLDFHPTFAEYLKAKKQIFDNLPKDAFALVNRDDRNGLVMVQNTKATIKTYALRSVADFQCKIIDCRLDGMQLNINGNDLYLTFIGKYNAYNLLAVYAAAMLLEQPIEEILRLMTLLKPVAGRLEFFRNEQGVTAVVDYAHTPDALDNVLQTLQEILPSSSSKIITVVGCGGDRDKKKRPEMARIAAEKSHRLIITSDNPRSEDPSEIIKDMLAGLSQNDMRKTLSLVDRREAIRTACFLAEKDDVILVAGKGHENYQIINGVKSHFDDREIIAEILSSSN